MYFLSLASAYPKTYLGLRVDNFPLSCWPIFMSKQSFPSCAKKRTVVSLFSWQTLLKRQMFSGPTVKRSNAHDGHVDKTCCNYFTVNLVFSTKNMTATDQLRHTTRQKLCEVSGLQQHGWAPSTVTTRRLRLLGTVDPNTLMDRLDVWLEKLFIPKSNYYNYTTRLTCPQSKQDATDRLTNRN